MRPYTTPPKSKKELMSFLGLVGFVRRFIPNYSDNTIKLTNLLKKKNKFIWDEGCQGEFKRLRNLITDYVLLSVPLTHRPFVILCDASNLVIGAVLCQWDNDHLNILEFASKKFNDSEKNWSIQEKEAFAIKWSVSKWEDYLKEAKVFVFTDHASLQWMGTSNTGKVQRWALFLQQFDITVRAISGKDNGMVDWLSRSTHDLMGLTDQEIDSMSIPVYTFIEEDKSNRKIEMSPYLPTYSQWVDSSKEIPEEDKKYLKLGKKKLYYSIRGMKLYVPPNLRESIMYYFHASRYGGHHGIRKTLRRITIWFYWPKIKEDLAKYINACLACKRTGAPVVKYLRGVLEKVEPFQLISIDFVGPREWEGYKLNYLVIIDHFSRFIVTKEVKNITSEEVISAINKIWVKYFGSPSAVLVDRGPAFISRRFKEFVVKELSSYLIFIGPGYPQGNAINESAHRGLEASIIARKEYEDQIPFEIVLREATMAYNSAPHSTVGLSPFYMLFGKDLSLPGLQGYQEPLSEETRMARIQDLKFQALRRAVLMADRNLNLYKNENYKVGDSVVYKLQNFERREASKENEEELVKYTAEWLLPVKIKTVKTTSLELISSNGKIINRSKRLVRKIGSDLPESLQQVSMSILNKELPKVREKPEWIRDRKLVKRPRLILS